MTATLTAAASGFSNWSHDVGGYLGSRLVERCPRELLLRWVQFGCFTPLMQAHGRFEQEAWRYDAHTLDTYRGYLLLHERLVPYIRAAAGTAAAAACRSSAHFASSIQGIPGGGPWATRICSGRRCGSRRWWRRGRRGAWPTCPRASGSSRGRARRTPAGATSWSRRRSIGSPSGCGRARSWSPTRPSTWPPGLGTRPRPIARWRRPYGAARGAGGRRRSWPMAPRCAGAAEAGDASVPRAAT